MRPSKENFAPTGEFKHVRKYIERTVRTLL